MKRFNVGEIVPTPDAAVEMYSRKGEPPVVEDYSPLVWSHDLELAISEEFRDLKNSFQFDPAPDRIWHDAVKFKTVPLRGEPRDAHRGNCNAFAPLLRDTLDIPLANMSLVLCRRDEVGHMVLAIDTTAGVLICCNIHGVHSLDSDEWRNFTWWAFEAPGAGPIWRIIERRVTLADTISNQEGLRDGKFQMGS